MKIFVRKTKFLESFAFKNLQRSFRSWDTHLRREWSFRVKLSPMHYAECARMHIRRTASGGKSDLKFPI